MPSRRRVFTPGQAAIMSDGFGRTSIIDIIYAHPKGITFRGIKRIEDRNRKQIYSAIEPIFHQIQKEQLEKFLKDIVKAKMAIEQEGRYYLVDWLREFFDQIMARARKEQPELFAQKKRG